MIAGSTIVNFEECQRGHSSMMLVRWLFLQVSSAYWLQKELTTPTNSLKSPMRIQNNLWELKKSHPAQGHLKQKWRSPDRNLSKYPQNSRIILLLDIWACYFEKRCAWHRTQYDGVEHTQELWVTIQSIGGQKRPGQSWCAKPYQKWP